MKINNLVVMHEQAEWHAWLEQHASDQEEAWIVFFKPHTGVAGISYSDALDEALCYGWIDSVIQKLDEDRYARKFSTRKTTTNWSDTNKRKVAQLIRDGRMTALGLAKLDEVPLDPERPIRKRPLEIPIPEHVERAVREASPVAWENLMRMAPSKRRNYILWLSNAKRPETFARRISEAVPLLEQNQPLGMK